MRDSLAPWYRYNYSSIWPSAKGLSVKYVNQLKIYPPHRHDFNTTGDTTEWAYKGAVSSDPPGSIDMPNDAFGSTGIIADDDGTFQIDFSNSNYAAHRFNFSIDTATDKDGPVNKIERLSITWNGKGWHDSGGSANGTSLYVWNGSGYEELDSTPSGEEESLTGEISADISNYVNSGNVTILVVQDTAGDEMNSSHIETDYVNLVVMHHHSNM
jgi:hypothetical protein